jgi:hypothetical protein
MDVPRKSVASVEFCDRHKWRRAEGDCPALRCLVRRPKATQLERMGLVGAAWSSLSLPLPGRVQLVFALAVLAADDEVAP